MRSKIAEIKMLLAADKKQATVLAGLLVFLVISMGRMLLNMSPSKASARQSSATQADQDQERSSGDAGAARGTVKLAPLPDSARDIFALNPEKFPEPARPEQSAEVGPKSDPGIDESLEADPLTRQQQTQRAVLAEADLLRLRSTILGANPIAVIESRSEGKTRSVVLGVGDLVDGFQIIEIRRLSVLIEKSGVRVELTRVSPET